MDNSIEEMKLNLLDAYHEKMGPEILEAIASKIASKSKRFNWAMPSKKHSRYELSKGRGVIKSDGAGVYINVLESLLKDCSQEEVLLLLDLVDRIEIRQKYINSIPIDTEDYLNVITVLKYIQDDQKKLELLEELESKTQHGYSHKYKSKVIASLNSEEKKIKYINELKEELKTGKEVCIWNEIFEIGIEYEIGCAIDEIVLSFESDDKKVQFGENNINIIKSLKSDEKKIELLDTFEVERQRAEIVATLNSDEKKLELLDTFNKAFHIDIITSLQAPEADEKKLELIEAIQTEDYREYLMKWADEHGISGCKSLYVLSRMDDQERAEYNKSLIDKVKTKIITSLSSGKKKVELMESLNNAGKAKVMSIISSDKDKEKLNFLKDAIESRSTNLYEKEDLVAIAKSLSEPPLLKGNESIVNDIEERTKGIKKIEKEDREKEEISKLQFKESELDREIEAAKAKVEWLTKKERLEKSIAAKQNELAELLKVLEKLEADRGIDD